MTHRRKDRISVLLTGGDDRSMLATTRSLARHGISFLVVGPGFPSMVASSRSVRGRFGGRAPNARSETEAYIDFILDVVGRHDVSLVLPLTDRTLFACDRHRDVIEAETRLAVAPAPAVRNVLDKRANLEAARRLGIPCPDQFELESREQVPELIARLGFPMVLKNPGPSVDGQRSPFRFRWLVARDERELDRYLAERCPPGAFPLFQRLVTGTVRNVCCFAVGGEIVAAHEFLNIRRWDGVSVFREVTPVAPDLQRYTELLLRELGWEGAAHVAFFVRESDGDVRYMETNGRFWGSLPGSVAAGWDFPYWTYRYFAEGEPPQPPPPSLWSGRKSRWHYGELAALLSYLSGDDEPSTAGRSRARAIADYLAGFRPGIDADVFRLDDPVPELFEHWRAARIGLSRVRNRAGRRWGDP